ncbi:MFS transporter [Vagococcus zengguangii]|nr:MFS transporter [Vagococcus zengguangii]
MMMTHLLLAIIYLAFISLGLPDSLLGSAWPTMYPELGVPISYAGILSMIIAIGTIISSLQSDRLTKRLGTGKVTAVSVVLTAIALLGFNLSANFWMLCLWAIPYGLGAGSVDASLNNYVAVNYESRHMSWLHCMWGVGATIGPYIMGYALTSQQDWHKGYLYIGLIQIILSALLLCSLPLWKQKKIADFAQEENNTTVTTHTHTDQPLAIKEVMKIPGTKEIMGCFFCYCALEQTASLWSSSYLQLARGISTEKAAEFASLFFIGITIGRAISGFLTFRMDDTQMIRLGQFLILLGIAFVLLPLSSILALVGLIMIGLGCAPIYPCIIHSTPLHFGEDKSQIIIGIQMAFAYFGTCIMPPLFGLLANHLSVKLFPYYLGVILLMMILLHEHLLTKTKKGCD